MAVKARDALEFLKSAKPNSGDDASKDDFNNVWHRKFLPIPLLILPACTNSILIPSGAEMGQISEVPQRSVQHRG